MPSLREFKCPACGGSLRYDIASKKVACPFCLYELDDESLNKMDEDLKDLCIDDVDREALVNSLHSKEEAEGKTIYSCLSCGGELLVDESTSATECPFCHSNILVKPKISGEYKPHFVIPFKISKDEAVESFKAYFKKQAFIPNAFKKQNNIDEVSSLYVPYWLFDSDADGSVTFKGEIERTWSDGSYRYKEVSYYRLYREGHVAFDNIPVDANKRIPDDVMESIEPFNIKDHTKFLSGYLAGFKADKYQVSLLDSKIRADQRVLDGTINAFKETIERVYTNVKVENSQVSRSNEKQWYALYPIWNMNVSWKGKTYYFGINGDTGKVAGFYPISKWKFFFMVLGVFLGGTGIGFGLGYLASEGIIEGLVIGLAIGIIASVITSLLVRKKLKKRVSFADGAKYYVRPGSFLLRESKDIFLHKSVTKIKISKS